MQSSFTTLSELPTATMSVYLAQANLENIFYALAISYGFLELIRERDVDFRFKWCARRWRRVSSRFNKFLLLDCMLTSQSETGKKISNYIYYYQDTIGRGNYARVYRSTNIITSKKQAI